MTVTYNESYLIGSLLDASADASIEFSDETSTAASSNGDGRPSLYNLQCP